MKPIDLKLKCVLALVVAGTLAAGPVRADKPGRAGGGRDERVERRDDDGRARHDRDRRSSGKHDHFDTRHRQYVHEYYAEEFRRGHCPPGLAKKHNGCMPPGQAKKWRVGHPLPRDVVFYEVPQQLVVKIGPPPSGYRYVRVASDILMIAVGTSMVVDAINDLGR